MHTTFYETLLPFRHVHRIGLALSGGLDSLTTLYYLRPWAKYYGVEVITATVDHGLREGSLQEAKNIQHLMRSWGISHNILCLSLPAHTSQAKARDARYLALARYFYGQAVPVICLGHHQDDQLETFFMRLMQGSGTFGLGCMMQSVERYGLLWVRPFLQIPKSWIESHKDLFPYIDDPSNGKLRFKRTHMRYFVQKLCAEERTSWLKEMNHYVRQKVLINKRVEELLKKNGFSFVYGHARIAYHVFKEPYSVFVLLNLLEKVRGFSPSLPSRRQLSILCKDFSTSSSSHHTLGGCVIKRLGGTVHLWREWGRIPQVFLKPGEVEVLWDRRFFVTFPSSLKSAGNLVLRPLGCEALSLKGYPMEQRQGFAGYPILSNE